MTRLFENKEHLVRMAGLFAAGLVVFLVMQALLVPEGFGVYGHFRAGALDDNQKRTPAYAGRASCAECHSDAGDALKAGKHASVGCEACHGPLARHAEDASAQKAERPDSRAVCLRCHLANVAKPAGFPQVQTKEHSPEGSCVECHPAHSPGLGQESAR
jgi:hypothetical protein